PRTSRRSDGNTNTNTTTISVAKNAIVYRISRLRSSTWRSFQATAPACRSTLVRMPVVDRLQLVVGQGVGRAVLVDQLAVAQHRDVIGDAGDRLEVVGHDHDDRARRLDLGEPG